MVDLLGKQLLLLLRTAMVTINNHIMIPLEEVKFADIRSRKYTGNFKWNLLNYSYSIVVTLIMSCVWCFSWYLWNFTLYILKPRTHNISWDHGKFYISYTFFNSRTGDIYWTFPLNIRSVHCVCFPTQGGMTITRALWCTWPCATFWFVFNLILKFVRSSISHLTNFEK